MPNQVSTERGHPLWMEADPSGKVEWENRTFHYISDDGIRDKDHRRPCRRWGKRPLQVEKTPAWGISPASQGHAAVMVLMTRILRPRMDTASPSAGCTPVSIKPKCGSIWYRKYPMTLRIILSLTDMSGCIRTRIMGISGPRSIRLQL